MPTHVLPAQHSRLRPSSVETKKPARSRTFQGWRFGLSAFVVIACLSSGVLVAVNPDSSREQLLLALALSCFSMAIVMGLLFASNAKLTGKIWGNFTFTVVGPSAIWLAGYLIIFYTLSLSPPAPTPRNVEELRGLAADVEKAASRGQLLAFDNWKERVPSGLVSGEEDETNIRHLLSAAFLTGQGHKKFKDPELQTLFYFLGPQETANGTADVAIKLQRLVSTGSDGNPELYMTSTPSQSSGEASSYAFAKSDSDVALLGAGSTQPRWIKLDNPVETTDVLVAAVYVEPVRSQEKGDWIFVHVPKYTQEGGTATVTTGFLTRYKVLTGTRLWEIRPAAFPRPATVPLLFHDAGGVSDKVTNLEEILNEQWLEPLRKWEKSPAANTEEEQAKHWLKTVFQYIDTARPSLGPQFLGSGMETENAVVLTIHWQRATTSGRNP